MSFKNINDVITSLNKDKDFPKEYNTFNELADELISIGNEDKVYAFYDEHLGLKDEVGDGFLNLKITESNIENNEDKVNEIIEVANNVIPLLNKELTEEDIDDIREDKMSRGEDPDEF